MPTRLQRAVGVLGLLCIIGLFGLTWWSANSTALKYYHQPTNTERGEKSSHKQNTQKPEISFWERTTEDPVAAFTAALTVFTAVLAAVSIVQFRFVIKADRTAVRAANAAQQAADALPALERPYVFVQIRSANVAGNILAVKQFDDRGFVPLPPNMPVGFEGIRPAHYDDRDSINCIEFIFVNYGKTPAIVTRVSASIDHATTTIEPHYTSFIPIIGDIIIPQNHALANGVVSNIDGIKMNYFIRDDIPLTHQAAVGISKGEIPVSFYGEITYRDVFGQEHVTKWWRRYSTTYGQFIWHGGSKHNSQT